MQRAYQESDAWRAAGGPPAEPKPASPGEKISIFRPNVYDGAALALYALRQEIGRPAFERLERSWVSLHRDGTATTADSRDLWVMFEEDLRPGYAWSFPLADDVVNVGLGILRQPGEPTRDLGRRFREVLEQGGVNVQFRVRKGDQIDAACGQLRRSTPALVQLAANLIPSA